MTPMIQTLCRFGPVNLDHITDLPGPRKAIAIHWPLKFAVGFWYRHPLRQIDWLPRRVSPYYSTSQGAFIHSFHWLGLTIHKISRPIRVPLVP